KVMQKRGDERARDGPQRQPDEKRSAGLREPCRQNHDRHGADRGADHAVPSFAERSPKLWLTHNRRRGSGPKWIVELEPERDVEGKADRGPEPQTKEQRRTGGSDGIRQRCAPSSSRPSRRGPTLFVEGFGHRFVIPLA